MNFRIEEVDKGDIELTVDTRFVASWGRPRAPEAGEIRLPVYMVKQMLEMAFSLGQQARSDEILKLLGGKQK